MTDALTDLGTTDLIKLVNDEYAAVLASDRATYPRAIRIGEALKVLTGRINHGDKKAWFKEHCPKPGTGQSGSWDQSREHGSKKCEG